LELELGKGNEVNDQNSLQSLEKIMDNDSSVLFFLGEKESTFNNNNNNNNNNSYKIFCLRKIVTRNINSTS
jgi:hypothetical protein